MRIRIRLPRSLIATWLHEQYQVSLNSQPVWPGISPSCPRDTCEASDALIIEKRGPATARLKRGGEGVKKRRQHERAGATSIKIPHASTFPKSRVRDENTGMRDVRCEMRWARLFERENWSYIGEVRCWTVVQAREKCLAGLKEGYCGFGREPVIEHTFLAKVSSATVVLVLLLFLIGRAYWAPGARTERHPGKQAHIFSYFKRPLSEIHSSAKCSRVRDLTRNIKCTYFSLTSVYYRS